MAAPWNPPVKNEDFEFDICLEDWLNPGLFKSNPTLAAGDVKISQNNGALANLTTLPTVSPASSKVVRVQLSQTEMNTDKVLIIFSDQTSPPEWCDTVVAINTSA
jgi:hypothetical protein